MVGVVVTEAAPVGPKLEADFLGRDYFLSPLVRADPYIRAGVLGATAGVRPWGRPSSPEVTF